MVACDGECYEYLIGTIKKNTGKRVETFKSTSNKQVRKKINMTSY